MRIGYVLNQFPELSQTFVLRQILDLLQRGHAVDVIAARPGIDASHHAALRATGDRFGLSRSTRYTNMPDAIGARLLSAARLLLPAAIRYPRLVANALDVRRFGWFAATGSLLTMAAPLARERLRFDAVIAHFGPQGVLAQGLREMGIVDGPLATFFHAYDLTSAPRLVGRGLYRRLFERGDLNIAISERGANQLRGLGAPPARVRVHHMGVNVSEFCPRPESRASGSRRPRVISIGRLVEKKGFGDGLRAVARARARGVPVDYSIYGSGPLAPSLERAIDQLGLRDCARLCGPASQERVAEILRDADLLLAPSLTSRSGDEEGIPIVLMEAMAAEVPVVTTDCGAVSELVTSEQSGLVVPQGSVDALAEALCRVCSSPELRRRLGLSGRARVLVDFNESEQGRRLVEMLGTLASTFQTKPRRDVSGVDAR